MFSLGNNVSWVKYERECARLSNTYGKPLQYSCLENSTDRGAWQATVHGVTKSQTRLKQLRMHALIILIFLCTATNI